MIFIERRSGTVSRSTRVASALSGTRTFSTVAYDARGYSLPPARVRAAFFAAVERSLGVCFRAAARACMESAPRSGARLSRFSARSAVPRARPEGADPFTRTLADAIQWSSLFWHLEIILRAPYERRISQLRPLSCIREFPDPRRECIRAIRSV